MAELLHQIVDHSAGRAPGKAAFRFDGESLGYGELVQRANGLARLLHANGVNPGDRVALLLPKSLELPIAVFGCLKAGAIVVPMDAQSPLDRLAVMIADAGIRCVIVRPEQQKLVSGLVAHQADLSTVIGIPDDGDFTAAALPWSAVSASDSPPPLAIDSDSPAYLLFTSGSTGQPKGILHSHSSALAYARLAADMYGVEPRDRLGNFAPLHFDQSTFEFYCGPLRGATTVLIPPAYGIMVASLADIIEKEALTFWYSVPSVLVRLLQSDALVDRDLTSIRWVLFGGEVFPPRQLERLMAMIPEARFSNVYGPTEVNQCTCFNFHGADKIPEPLPIGQVWGETQALVVDENDAPVGDGEIGELLIHSSTMMTGYWERPDLNEQAFYEHTLDDGSETRFYRTGDLVKAEDDGNLVFLGRKDRQVKSRGFRVELDEVESVLSQLDGVEEAATFTVMDESEMLLIDAAVRLRSDSSLTDRDVAAHAARLLPGYARPRKVHVLEDFPRTRTGKVDRNAVAELTGKL